MASFYIDLPAVSVSIPAGGATSANQALEITALDSIDSKSDLPVKFNKDGVATIVNYDTGTPANSEALPVNIVTVNGQGISTTVDLSGAQVNVQLTDRGTSPDSVRIGDGSDFLAVNSDGSINAAAVLETMSETLALTNPSAINNTTWTQLIASTANTAKAITWFESTGFPMEIAIGASSSEVRKFVVPPGGFNGKIPMDIPAGSRLSARSLVTGTISANGLIIANFYK